MCTYEKKGTLTVYKNAKTKRIVKEGGNIISYICAPDGRVLHAVPGSPAPESYLAHLQLGADLAALEPEDVRLRHVDLARLNSSAPLWTTREVHKILALRAAPAIETIEERMFKEIVGQTYAPAAAINASTLSEKQWNDQGVGMVFG